MGGKDSKPVFVTYEDALDRVTEAELKRLKEAFKRSSSLSGYMPRNAFFREVLGDNVPLRLAEQMFIAMGGSQKGISFRDLLCGLVVLTNGELEEQIKFIFGIYASETFPLMSKLTVDRLVLETEGAMSHDLAELFRQEDSVSYEVFRDWAVLHQDALSITRWLLMEKSTVSLSSDFDAPTFNQTLAGVTHLDESDISELEKQYWSLKGMSKSGRFDIETFSAAVSPPMPPELCQGLFGAFDENLDNHIDFKEMACGISACCRGPMVEKHKFCFKVFDRDRDGLLSVDELRHMLAAMLIVHELHQSTAAAAAAADVEALHCLSRDNLSDASVEVLVDEILSSRLNHCSSVTKCVSQEEYLVWAVNHPSLPSDFLTLLTQVCHVVFGLRPQSKEEECDIVLSWRGRELRQGLKPGQTWYLISMAWWKQYVDYIGRSQLSADVITKPPASSRGHCRAGSLTLCPPSLSRCTSSDPEDISSAALTTTMTSNSSTSDVSVSGGRYATVPRSSTGSSGVIMNASELMSDTRSSMSTSIMSELVKNIVASIRPGAIDNSLLVASHSRVPTLTNEGGCLKRDRRLRQGVDYEIVSESMWKALALWYGKGTFALPRTVIVSRAGACPELELYPVQVKLLRYQVTGQRQPNSNMFAGMVGSIGGVMSSAAGMAVGSSATQPPRRYVAYTAAFSCQHTLQQVYEFLTTHLKISREDMHLWKVRDEQNVSLLEAEEKTMEQLGIEDGTQILIEVRNKDLTWPEELCQLAKNKALLDKSQTVPIERGATGLNNLGNTCFMNSALQCISNTFILTTYFTSGLHLYELNRSNPLGARGNLAQRYGELVKDLWSATARSIAPLKLRWTIGKYAPCFNGFQQHDSQELLACVLDGLHEDLNRVHEKPYVELKDSDGRPDDIVAKEAWDNHLLRNQSIVVDLFHGQLKSCVRCIQCQHTSVKFDPFTFLSLPLPMDSCIYLEIIVVRLNEPHAVKYGLCLNIDDKYRDLKKQLSVLCGVPASRLLLVEVYEKLVRNFPSDIAKVKTNIGGSLIVYELPVMLPLIAPMSAAEEIGGYMLPSNHLSSQQSTPQHHRHHGDQQQQWGLAQIQRGLTKNCTASAAETYCTAAEFDALTVNGNDDAVHHHPHPHHHPHHLADSGDESVQSSDEGVSSNDVMLTVDSTACSNGASTLSAGDTNGVSTTSTGDGVGSDGTFSGFVVAMHRKMIHMDLYFLSSQKSRPCLFGMPMIIPCDAATTHQDLYEQVWSRVSYLVTPLPPSDAAAPNHAQDCDDSLGYEYPFSLKAVQKDGCTCTWCPWYRFCSGCKLECSPQSFNSSACYIAVDWEPTALHLRYHASQEKLFVDHESVESSRRQQTEPIGLDTCLKAFTKEEQLGEDELYYCSKCKKHRLAAKKLEIWRLPAILIIHLKRFQFHNGRWVKSHKIVKFPFRDFDPTNYLVPGSSHGNHHRGNHNNNTETDDNYSSGYRVNDDVVAMTTAASVQQSANGHLATDDAVADGTCSSHDNSRRINHHTSTSSDNMASSTSSSSLESQSPAAVRYSLYAVSCHTGILGGGHYVTYARNPNNKWYCYNDSSCKEVTEEQVDINSAYILFYERQSLDSSIYMPDICDKEPVTVEVDDDFEKDFKKFCIIQ